MSYSRRPRTPENQNSHPRDRSGDQGYYHKEQQQRGNTDSRRGYHSDRRVYNDEPSRSMRDDRNYRSREDRERSSHGRDDRYSREEYKSRQNERNSSNSISRSYNRNDNDRSDRSGNRNESYRDRYKSEYGRDYNRKDEGRRSNYNSSSRGGGNDQHSSRGNRNVTSSFEWDKSYPESTRFDWTGESFVNGTSKEVDRAPSPKKPIADLAENEKKRLYSPPQKSKLTEEEEYERHMAEQEERRMKRIKSLR